jgi:hypothetical protein
VLNRGITDEYKLSNMVMQWADKCADLRRLDPSRQEFEYRVRTRIRQVIQGRLPHMGLDRLKEEYSELWKKIMLSGGWEK